MNRTPALGKTIRLAATVALVWLNLFSAASAAPRYTDRENARALAQALDKGIFRNAIIQSTFIQSIGGENYYIKVVLDNGTSQDWTLEQIHQWSKAEAFLLSGNRVLMFPAEDSNAFVVLDKNEFVRQALAAKTYAKHYEGNDPLAGTTIHYAVRGFNLAELLGIAAGWDAQGYRHHYVLDLVNGQREFLSYLEAYDVMQRKGLLDETAAPGTVLDWPYRLKQMIAHEAGPKDENGTARFSLELVFDEPVALRPAHFPVQVFEMPANDHGGFTLQVTLPNAELGVAVQPIAALEFLNTIRVQNDANHAKRLLLHAKISPDVLEFPPQVEVRDHSVSITFVKVVDQTVLSRKSLLEENLRRQQEQLLGMRLTDEQKHRRQSYVEAFEAGFKQLEGARAQDNMPARIAMLHEALAHFRAAAANASTDLELHDALRERNNLAARIPLLVTEHVQAQLEAGTPSDPESLKRLIAGAASLTRDLETLRTLRDLLRKL